MSGLIKRGVFAPSDYLRNLSKVVLTLGRHGKGVIVGRGAHFLLDPQATLRVRVIAPLETRVARIAARDGLSEDEARAKILRIDGERIAFNKQHYGADIADPVPLRPGRQRRHAGDRRGCRPDRSGLPNQVRSGLEPSHHDGLIRLH